MSFHLQMFLAASAKICSTSQRVLKRLLLPLFLIALNGCAAQLAYRDGQRLIEEDKLEAGLLKFKVAIDADPGNAQYRITYLKARDAATARLLVQAENLAATGRFDEANSIFKQCLMLDPLNERARAGLQLRETNARHDRQIAAAESALEKKDPETARQRLAEVLGERPEHIKARALLRNIEENVAPLKESESGLSQQFKKPISIEFRGVPLRQVFDVISQTSGLNFIFDKDVRADQNTTIVLKDSTIELALYYLLSTNQLEQQILDRNTVMIYPSTAIKLKEYQEMVIKSFFLANADAKVVANTLKTILRSKDIVVDEKLNLVIMRDNRDAIRLAEKLVALQDISEPEVMLEVEVLEVKTSRLLELGVTWPSSVTLAPLTSATGLGLTISDLRQLNQTNIGITTPSLTINANKKDGDSNTLANPRIRVRNKEKAKIQIGERLPSVTTTVSPGAAGFASESVTYIDVGLSLNVEPTIYLNNEIAIKVDLEVSNLLGQITTKSGTVGYQIGTRKASTMLQLRDGENQVLAGLISNEDRSNGNKVPVAGDLPIIGRLFGSNKDDTQKTEIVLSITPRLIRNIKRPDASLSEIVSGTDTNFRNRPENRVQQPRVLSAPALPVPAPASMTAPAPAANTNQGVTGPLNWHGPSSLNKGDTFIVQLSMQPDKPVLSMPLTLGFDPKVLEVINVTEGNFMNQDGAASSFKSSIDPTGKISVTAVRNAEQGAKNFGIFTSISFRAIAPSNLSEIRILNTSPTGEDKQAVNIATPSPYTFRVQ